MKVLRICLLSLLIALPLIKASIFLILSSELESVLSHNNNKELADLDSFIVLMLEGHASSAENPCDDFYTYANGRYYATDKISFFDVISFQYDDSVKNYFDHTNWDRDLTDLRSKMGSYSTFCNLAYKLVLADIFDNFEKTTTLKWPNWILALEQEEWEQDFDWMKAMGVLRRYGLNNIFFKEHLTLAYNNSNKLIIELGMPDDLKELSFIGYKLYDFLSELLGEKKSEFERFQPKLKQLEELAKNVRQMHRPNFNEVETKEILTLEQLEQRIPLFDWTKYFSAMLERSVSGRDIEIQLRNPKYIKDIVTLMDQTAEKEIIFYMLLHFMHFYKENRPDDYGCYQSLVKQFSFGANYLNNRFREDKKENELALQQIFNALKSQFMKVLQQNKYKLNARELQYLQQKLNKMILRVGTTPLDFEPEFYDKFYENVFKNYLNDTFDGYLHDVLNFRVKKQHEGLFHSQDKKVRDYFYAYDDSLGKQFEPFYVPQLNVLIVPQVFLNPPFFSHWFKKVFQYATAGFGIARALTNAFTPENLIYNADGNEDVIGLTILQNTDYQNKLICFQNTEFRFSNVNQRIADITGMQLMLDTFYAQVPNTPQEAGLEFHITDVKKKDYNMKDLFFRDIAQYFIDEQNYINKERLGAIFDHVSQLTSFYNCTVKSEICTLW